MSKVVAFPAAIPNADFVPTQADVIADKLLTLTGMMHHRAMCALSPAAREAMITDALEVIALVRRA